MKRKRVNRLVPKAVRRGLVQWLGPGIRRAGLTAEQLKSVAWYGWNTGQLGNCPTSAVKSFVRADTEDGVMVKRREKQRANRPGADVGGKAGDLWRGARVKDAGSRLSVKRWSVKRPDGRPLLFGSTALEHPSERDKAVLGVWFKLALRRNGMAVEFNEFERSLLAEAAEQDRWVGTTPGGVYYGGGPDGFAPATTVKALLDDTTSGGLFLNPVTLDQSIVVAPLLSGQLFPLVDLVPVQGRRVTTPAMANMQMSWGAASGTAVQPFSTAGLISPLDCAVMPVNGYIEIGNDLLADSPVEIGGTIVGLFGERLKAELDRVLAVGNGTSEPLGIVNTSGLAAVSSDSGVGGPPTVSDYEALIFSVPLQYRQKDWNPCFVGNDVSYRRARGIAVGPADERRVFGMDEGSYQLLEYPYRVANDLANTQVLFGCLKKYRLFARLGMEVVRESGGRTLTLSNTSLIGLRARYGGRVVDGAAFALMSDCQN